MGGLAGSLAAAGSSVLLHQLLEPMPRQLEFTREIVERERRLQQQVAEQLVAPVDAIFDLLRDGATTLRRQAEALQAAGRAVDETAGLMKLQAERFEETVNTLRAPLELAKAAAGVTRRPGTSRAADDGWATGSIHRHRMMRPGRHPFWVVHASR